MALVSLSSRPMGGAQTGPLAPVFFSPIRGPTIALRLGPTLTVTKTIFYQVHNFSALAKVCTL